MADVGVEQWSGEGLPRRTLTGAVLRTLFTSVVLLALYAVLPAAHADGRTIVELLVGLVVFAGVLTLQIRAILRADHPIVRAAEALVIATLTLIVVFSFTYLSLAASRSQAFNQTLDHASAFYFTVTVLSTVGFGDIVAVSDPARLVVTAQMLIDLVLLVAIGRVLLAAAKIGKARHRSAAEDRRTASSGASHDPGAD